MNSYVFIGPTISEGEARQWLNAVYLPPVSQGDIASLLRHQPKIIGIIDGYFERVPSVWHKEILLALSQGVHVVGGASMGALRAAELHPFGMVGVGQVFEWYREGKIEADDEVAVQHAPASHHYKPGNEALVNIRKTLEAACEQSIITPATLAALIALGQRIYYPERSYRALLDRGAALGLPNAELQHLKEFVTQQWIDQKKLDAIEVLKHIANLAGNVPPATVSFELQYTDKLERLLDKDVCLATIDGIRLTADLLINSVRLESDDFAGLKNRALAGGNAAETASPKILASLPKPNNHDLIRQLRREGQYEAMTRLAVAKERLFREVPPGETPQPGQLYAYYLQRKPGHAPEDIAAGAAYLGFGDLQIFTLELIKFYCYHQLE
jgi:hypothetical protein